MDPARIFAVLAAVASVVGAAAAQEPEAPNAADLRAQVPAMVKQLNAAVSDRGMMRDSEAAALIQQPGDAYAAGLPKTDARKAVTAVANVLQRAKLRPPDAPIYDAAAAALAQMGDAGAKVLQRVLETKRLPNKKEWVPTRASLLLALGRTGSDAALDFLLEQAVRSPEDEMLAAAGEALGNFSNRDEKVRKRMVVELVKKLGAVEATALQPTLTDPNEPQYYGAETAKRTLRAIRERWLNTLTKLTGETFDNGTDWQRWYNKNKNVRWEDRPQ
jgi:hypothetical protein